MFYHTHLFVDGGRLYTQKKGEKSQYKMVTLGKVLFSVVSQMTTQSEKKEGKKESPELQVYLVSILQTFTYTIVIRGKYQHFISCVNHNSDLPCQFCPKKTQLFQLKNPLYSYEDSGAIPCLNPMHPLTYKVLPRDVEKQNFHFPSV